jgi:myosin heavy subunit
MKILNERCIGLARVMGQLEHSSTKGLSESDFFKLREGMDELLSTLVETSKNELELGIKTRELEKKNHEISRLKNDNQKLQDNYRHMSEENAELKRLKIDLQQKLHMSELEKEQLKIQNQDGTKRINTLEKRVSLMLEVDYSSNNDEMRKALGELVKDNEELKRKLNGKANELKRANEEINRAKTKVTRQNRKIENLTKKKGAPSDDFATLMQANTDLNLLQLGNLPSSLDFRTSSLKFHYAELLNDIMEQGPLVFIDQLHKLNSVKDQDEAIHFVVNQLISYKEFGERLHLFLKQSYEIFKLRHIEELMVYLNKYTKQIFTCEQVHLWCPDRATGIFYTIEQTKSEIRCLSTKGLISEVLKNNKAFNSKTLGLNFNLTREKYEDQFCL